MPFKPARKTPSTSRRIPGRRPQWNPTMGNTAPTIGISAIPGVPIAGAAAPPAVGGGSNMFSVGNAANGRINLGGILGTRANENFDPANPNGELPYAKPSFLRRMFGDSGDALNAQYVGERNAQAQADADWKREADLKWQMKKADLDMEAARANATNAAHVQGIQMQTDTQRSWRDADRETREFEKYGTNDPIVKSDLARQEAEQNRRLAAFRPLGGSAFVKDNPYGDPSIFAREGGTPGGQPIFGPGGEFMGMTQPSPGQFVELGVGGGRPPVGGSGAPSTTPTGTPKPKINPQALQDFNSTATQPPERSNYIGDFSLRPPQPQPQVGMPTMLNSATQRSTSIPSLTQDFGVQSNSWTPEQRKMMFDEEAKKQAIINHPVTQTLLQRILGTLPK